MDINIFMAVRFCSHSSYRKLIKIPPHPQSKVANMEQVLELISKCSSGWMEVGHEILKPSTAAAAGLTWPHPVSHQDSSSSQKCQISWRTVSQCGGGNGGRKSVRKATFITWQDSACRGVWSGSEISLDYLNEEPGWRMRHADTTSHFTALLLALKLQTRMQTVPMC